MIWANFIGIVLQTFMECNRVVRKWVGIVILVPGYGMDRDDMIMTIGVGNLAYVCHGICGGVGYYFSMGVLRHTRALHMWDTYVLLQNHSISNNEYIISYIGTHLHSSLH